LDAASGQEGREVMWSAAEFTGFRHGYAGTIYKGQGKTLDHTYLYHTHHWRSTASYVALTRQRESAQVFVARETARDATQLARQMARGEIKVASVAWATADELAPAQRQRATRDRLDHQEERTEQPNQKTTDEITRASEAMDREVARPSAADPASPAARPTGETERTRPSETDKETDLAAPEILIPAYVGPDGRDSLGRGLDDASIAIAAAEDRVVRREKEALWLALRTAYRDPHAAKASLDEMVKRQGWTSTAARLRPDPTQLGTLYGRSGLFAGRWTKLERAGALGAAGGVASHLKSIGAAEAKATAAYRASVEAQRKADATPVPKLSPRAEAALAVLATAPAEHVRADLWRGLTTDKVLGPELERFSAAVRQRFGDDTVRAMLRAKGGSVAAASVPRQHQATLSSVSRTVNALREGECASDRQVETQRIAQRQTLGYRARPRP
jgi:hypothetical protein